MDRIHYNDDDILVIPFDSEHEALAALETNFEAYIRESDRSDTRNVMRLSAALAAIHRANRLVSEALSGCPDDNVTSVNPTSG
jgi:hypothetical protein